LSITLNGAKAKLLNKLALQVLDNHLSGTNLLRLGADLVPILFLAYIGKKADDFVALVKQPAQDGASVKAACVESQSWHRYCIEGRGSKTCRSRPGRLFLWTFCGWLLEIVQWIERDKEEV
jgi:hypothetical protein